MDDYKIIIEQEHQTVMAHYEVEPKPAEGKRYDTCTIGSVPLCTTVPGTM